jgi:threonine 3-dehydrogenase
MKTKMKAIVKPGPAPGLELREEPVPEYGINDVLIKIRRTSICGTDVHIYNWDEWAARTIPAPMIIGHEFVGEIIEIGSNVKDFHPGDIVSGEGHLVCGKCRNCLAGRRHLCAHTCGIGVNRQGAFAEYIAIPVTNVWYCDRNISEDVLSCFDPLGNAVHTALSFDVLGEDVLITGTGPIGIMAVAVAKHAGARFVVASDVNPYRLELARKMGADRTVDITKENLEDVPAELKMQEGFDVGLEMSGNPSAFNTMINLMCHGGKIAMLGIQPPNTCVDWNKVVFNGLTVKGIYGREMYETWYKMTAMIQSGLDVTSVITHRFRFDEFEKGFDVMRAGVSGKVVLDWT